MESEIINTRTWKEWLSNDPEAVALYLESVLLKAASGVDLTDNEQQIVTLLIDIHAA
jgi:hypothetical protein